MCLLTCSALAESAGPLRVRTRSIVGLLWWPLWSDWSSHFSDVESPQQHLSKGQDRKRSLVEFEGGGEKVILVKYKRLRTNWVKRAWLKRLEREFRSKLAQRTGSVAFCGEIQTKQKKWKQKKRRWSGLSFIILFCNYKEHSWQSLKFSCIYNSEIQSVWYKNLSLCQSVWHRHSLTSVQQFETLPSQITVQSTTGNEAKLTFQMIKLKCYHLRL